MTKVRISKYDPKYRVNGIYTKEEWTDYSDIGNIFDGHMFTFEDYLRIERNYLDAIYLIINSCQMADFVIDSLELYDETSQWEKNMKVCKNEVSRIITDCLRNKCWCRLKSNEYYIHFGYDFYVYLSVPLKINVIKRVCKMYGLFVENIVSPYEDVNGK